MSCFLKQCTVSDFNTLRELSIKTYYETFAHLNTPEDMAAYLEDAFNVERFSKELNDPNSVFSFLYCNEQIAGYLKLNEAPSQTDINDPSALEIERIYVTSEFQGEGLGRFLIGQASLLQSSARKSILGLVSGKRMKRQSVFTKRTDFMKLVHIPSLWGRMFRPIML